ncbi:MAG TPA: HAMP domain-containing sensor histidine kinase [Longimicrobiaceae bacterium]|nr:HAMP domain-containing sensor histidine kinase [Longimicrobiaceae bacterium]
MTPRPDPPSLRREIVLWYSVILLVALTLFAGLTYLILARTLAGAGTASLRQSALTAEQLIIPSHVPRVTVEERQMPPGKGDVEALLRRSRLPNGDVLDIYVARTGDVEGRALRSFLVISLILIPLTAAAAAVAGRSLADRILRPLDRLVSATREIGIGALSRRVEEPDRPAELRELSLAFNGMLERLERAVDTLRRFTADASHELRTPLTAIQGSAQVALARERPPEELRETLGGVLEETRWMLGLVEGLLTLARGEESAPGVGTGRVELLPLLEDVRDIGEALAAGKPVEVRLEAAEPFEVVGEERPLRQLFLNLVSNAVKFTDSGVVTLRAATVEDPEGTRWIDVAVEDTGTGIAPEELPRVFDRFYRGDEARVRAGGTGLGLAIARMVAERHGGTIHAESEPGRGSTFTVRLPAAPEAVE